MTSRIFIADLLFKEGSRPGAGQIVGSRRRSDRKRRGAAQQWPRSHVEAGSPSFPNTGPLRLFRARRIRSCRPTPSRKPAAPSNFVGLVVISRGIEAGVFRENPLAGDIIDLDPRTDGILEQHRIISRRPGTSLRHMHDLGFLLAQKREDLVDILAASRTEAEMM